MVATVILFPELPAEYAVLRLLGFDVFHSPRGPESFQISSFTCWATRLYLIVSTQRGHRNIRTAPASALSLYLLQVSLFACLTPPITWPRWMPPLLALPIGCRPLWSWWASLRWQRVSPRCRLRRSWAPARAWSSFTEPSPGRVW